MNKLRMLRWPLGREFAASCAGCMLTKILTRIQFVSSLDERKHVQEHGGQSPRSSNPVDAPVHASPLGLPRSQLGTICSIPLTRTGSSATGSLVPGRHITCPSLGEVEMSKKVRDVISHDNGAMHAMVGIDDGATKLGANFVQSLECTSAVIHL